MNGIIQSLNNWLLPQTLLLQIIFYGIASFTLLSAFLVVSARHLFHSALYLAMTLIGVACVYLYLDAEFLAMVQILIYVGAVVTLFIFTIMLTSDLQKKFARRFSARAALSFAAAGCLLFVLVKIILSHPWPSASAHTPPPVLTDLGRSLITTFVLPFELLSLLALAVLVGSLFIAGRNEN